jgi:hypothetical protein
MASAPPDYCALLRAAEKTYDDWLQGRGVIEFQDQNGERIKRSPANLDLLATRIAELRRLCDPAAALRGRRRAIGFTF